MVGVIEGFADGANDGVADGINVGALDGARVGALVGRGEFNGINDGCTLGWPVGCAVNSTYVERPLPVSLLYVFVANQLGNVPVM